ncbi:hypothetical protein [Halobacterium bonnevillei]|uniref:Uncharacterized protein n=1 Tax=Halobacterium bonnevillei TaxID=2692200 RepID=A0A6B0SNA8_9EURY|nr:hypothetical protein [Halobacterium bonnevillei]MXR20330.1 hypothetical protein [Halobacterium bonnevillei]
MEIVYSLHDWIWRTLVNSSRGIREALLFSLPPLPIILSILHLSKLQFFSGGIPFLIWYYFAISTLLAFFMRVYSNVTGQISEFWRNSFPSEKDSELNFWKSLRSGLSEYSKVEEQNPHLTEQSPGSILPHCAYFILQIVESLIWFYIMGSLIAMGNILLNIDTLARQVVETRNVQVIGEAISSSFIPANLVIGTGLIPESGSTTALLLLLLSPSVMVATGAISNLFRASEGVHRKLLIGLINHSSFKSEPIFYIGMTVFYAIIISLL